jgi:uncharacterized membrane protein
MPGFAYVLPIAGVLLCLPAGNTVMQRRPLLLAVWFVALAGAAAFLMMTALYLAWTPVGLGRIQGVQGRYFIPMLPALAVAFGAVAQVRTSRRMAAISPLGLIVLIGVLAVTAQATIATAYGRLG